MLYTSLAVLSRIASNSILNTEQKRLSAFYNSSYTNFCTYFLLFLVAAPLFFVFYLKYFTIQMFLWAFCGGFFGAIGNVFLIAALKYGELSILGPVNSYKAVVGLAMGALIIKEFPGVISLLGVVIIIAGSYFVFDATKEGFSFSLFKRKDIQFRIFALIFTAIEAVFIKKVIILSDVFCSLLLWIIFGCVFSFFILKAKRESFCAYNLKPFLPLSMFVFIMQLSTNYVFVKIPVGVALSLFQLSNVLNVFLGYKIFHEKHLLKKLAGSIIMVIGAVIIICCS